MMSDHTVIHDVGGRLRHARQQRGLSLHDAAGLTKLPMYVLQAIERNDFDRLPAGMYRKAYIRTLAGELGVDPNEMATRYSEEWEPAIESPPPDRDSALQESSARQIMLFPRWSIVAVVALAASAALWFMLHREPVVPTMPLGNLPSKFFALPIPDAVSLALADTRGEAVPRRAIAAQTTDVSRLRIGLAAMGQCWVAADVDGERVMYRLLEPGEGVVLEGQRTISLRLGDAGSVTLSINDGPRRSVGGDGEVVELELTPDNVEALRDGAAGTLSED